MIKKTAVLLLLLMGSYGFAQQTQPIDYIVQKGETLYSISRKYGITPYDILSKNPDLKVDELQVGVHIQVPAWAAVIHGPQGVDFFYHVVARGETLASLKRTYGVSLKALKDLNPNWAQGLAIGQRVKIPSRKGKWAKPLVEQPKNNTFQTDGDFELYTVKPHETLYALSKLFDVSIEDIKDWNGGLPQGLKAGMQLHIRRVKIDKKIPYDSIATRSTGIHQKKMQRDTTRIIRITVQPGQTLFGIIRKAKVSFDQLLAFNPALVDGLQAGMVLALPWFTVHQAPDFSTVDFGDKTDVGDQIGAKTRLKVVLLAPFYTHTIPDTTSHSGFNTDSDAIANDKSQFATEFTIGAKLALERLEKKGLHIDFSIFDTGRDVHQLQDIFAANDFEGVDLIIGPFYTDLSELAAQWVGHIPVVSPFSQRLDLNGHPNLIQLRPSAALMQEKVLDWVRRESKPANRIWILGKPSPARDEAVNYLRSKTILPVEVMAELPDDSTMYELAGQTLQVVFPDSANADYAEGLYKLAEINTDSTHIRAYFTHDVNDYANLPIRDKIGLQITLPRMPYCDRDRESYRELEKKFIEKYEMGPGIYELMGYDVVYDFLMRLSQYPGLYQSLQTQKSRDIQLITDFKKRKGGGYFNDAVSLLRYDGKNGFQPIDKAKEQAAQSI